MFFKKSTERVLFVVLVVIALLAAGCGEDLKATNEKLRKEVADLTADYRISMREVPGQWRVTSYEVEEIVEAMGR